MKRWDLRSLPPSSKKQNAREPGADAPRTPRSGAQMPRVLFTSPECRAVVLDLLAGEKLGEHHVRQRAVVEVFAGSVSIESSGETVECDSGTLVTFDPGEHHSVRASTDARLLLLLAPWSADPHAPANAMTDSIPPAGAPSRDG